MSIVSSRWLVGAAIFLLFIIDRLIKLFLLRNFDVLPGLSLFDFAINNNLAFNIFLPQGLIIGLVLFVIILLALQFIQFIKLSRYWLALTVLAVIVGALSNFIDRLLYGGVIDYIKIVSWWPVFNLADVLISVGLISWLYILMRKKGFSGKI